MKVSLKVAFNLLDGRMSTEMSDVYNMLSYIFGRKLSTIELPSAMYDLEEINPQWFKSGLILLDYIKKVNDTYDFQKLMEIIDSEFADYEIELSPISPLEKASDVLAKLKIEAENLDIENAHSNADDILSDFVRHLGFEEIANAYDDVPKWFA